MWIVMRMYPISVGDVQICEGNYHPEPRNSFKKHVYIYIPRASHMLLISAFPVRNAFLHQLSSILLSDLFCHFWIFLSSTSIVRFEHCPIVQGHPNPSRFSGGNKWCLYQTFFKANIEPQQLCAETNVYWWASVAKQFWWRRFEPIQKRFFPIQKRFYPYPSFG